MPIKKDNFFLLIFRALRDRRVPIALRIASHNMILVALVLVVYAIVMGLRFTQAMHEQADVLGQSLSTQTANSATQLLVSNDILSLHVLLNNLTTSTLVAHAAIYDVDNRILAEAGQRPKNGLLGETQGVYRAKITFQNVTAGYLYISLDMNQFEQPVIISLQSMGILSAILLTLALALSLCLGRHITAPLLQLRVWLREPDPYTPAIARQDEIGDLACQLHSQLAPPAPEPEAKPEQKGSYENNKPTFEVRNLNNLDFSEKLPVWAPKAAPLQIIRTEEDPFVGLRDTSGTPAMPKAQPKIPQPSAVLAVQLGTQEQLRRLPRFHLMELLEHYRDCLYQAASLYQSELHILSDDRTLMLFHSDDSGDDYLINAICCGELLRALGHTLQIEVADSSNTLQLQLGLVLGEGLNGLSQIDLLLTKTAQDTLALSQHSRNLLLVERKISDEPLTHQCARIRPIASPEGACCVEQLLEPYPSILERQLARVHTDRGWKPSPVRARSCKGRQK